MGRRSRELRVRREWRTAQALFLEAFDRAYDRCAALRPGETCELTPIEGAALGEVLYGRNRRRAAGGRP